MTEERERVRSLVAGHIALDLVQSLCCIPLSEELIKHMMGEACKAAMAVYDAAQIIPKISVDNRSKIG